MNINAKTIDLAKVQADAEESYRKGFFCCEAVMETIMDNFELDGPYETIRMASGMAIGVGKSGCICGALNCRTFGAREGMVRREEFDRVRKGDKK